jgi:lysophospholipase L1-like esterase
MKKIPLRILLVITSLVFFTDVKSFAQNIQGTVVSTNVAVENIAILPVLRTNPTNWVARHEGFVAIAKKGNVDLLFMGDSITDGWRGRGLNVWNKYYAPQHAANFGISGDRTEHVLWRMDNGELDGIKPKVVVLMIGTNNTGKEKDGHLRNTIPQVIEGVTAVVKDIQAKLPETKILLLAIFPRGTIDDFQRGEVAVINQALAKLDNGNNVKFLDIGSKFLEADGTLPRSIMPDLLHPNEQGYQIWADAMNPTLDEMMK